MRFQTPLVPARLIRRYKRFLADIRLDDGSEVTAHCANPGSMMGLADPDTRIWVEPNDDPKKKLKYGWRLVEHDDGYFTSVDTSLANRALKEAFQSAQVPDFADYPTILAEQKYAERSRIDFLFRAPERPDFYVEVKSVTLMRTRGLAEFPDSITARGARHMADLAHMVELGQRAMVLYLVQRTDAERVSVAGDIDPNYAAALADAVAKGVEVQALSTAITPEGIDIGPPLPFAPPAS